MTYRQLMNPRRNDSSSHSGLVSVRVGWGCFLLVARPGVTGALGFPSDNRTITVMHVLGVRHLVQAAITGHTARLVRRGALVDLAHGVSMLLWATVDERRRVAALLDATVAIGFATAGLMQ